MCRLPGTSTPNVLCTRIHAYNNWCFFQGGLNDQARQTCKNLEYAIAIATRPGAIEYYRPTEEARRIVEKGDLAVLTRKITHLQRDIDQVQHRTWYALSI